MHSVTQFPISILRKEASELTQLAPTVTHANKCLFVVRVTYYLQVVLVFGLLTKTLAMKLPFVLQRSNNSKYFREDQRENPEIQVNESFVQPTTHNLRSSNLSKTPTHKMTPSNLNKQKKQSNEV